MERKQKFKKLCSSFSCPLPSITSHKVSPVSLRPRTPSPQRQVGIQHSPLSPRGRLSLLAYVLSLRFHCWWFCFVFNYFFYGSSDWFWEQKTAAQARVSSRQLQVNRNGHLYSDVCSVSEYDTELFVWDLFYFHLSVSFYSCLYKDPIDFCGGPFQVILGFCCRCEWGIFSHTFPSVIAFRWQGSCLRYSELMRSF